MTHVLADEGVSSENALAISDAPWRGSAHSETSGVDVLHQLPCDLIAKQTT